MDHRFEHRQEVCKLKVEKFKAKTIQKPSPDWTWPLLGTWKKQNNSAPYWAMHVSHLARYESFIFSTLTPTPWVPWDFHQQVQCFPVPFWSSSAGRWKTCRLPEERAVLFSSTWAYSSFCLTCLRLEACFSPVTWLLCLAHKCSQINNSGLHMTS